MICTYIGASIQTKLSVYFLPDRALVYFEYLPYWKFGFIGCEKYGNLSPIPLPMSFKSSSENIKIIEVSSKHCYQLGQQQNWQWVNIRETLRKDNFLPCFCCSFQMNYLFSSFYFKIQKYIYIILCLRLYLTVRIRIFTIVFLVWMKYLHEQLNVTCINTDWQTTFITDRNRRKSVFTLKTFSDTRFLASTTHREYALRLHFYIMIAIILYILLEKGSHFFALSKKLTLSWV